MTVQTSAPAELTGAPAVVAAAFGHFAQGDVAGFGDQLHADATWNHRNPDRLGGIHQGRDAIVAFLRESVQLTSGTLRAEPRSVLSDGASCVVVLVQISGTRPDGRTFEDQQVLVITVDGDRMRSIDQYIGDPPAVTAFWA